MVTEIFVRRAAALPNAQRVWLLLQHEIFRRAGGFLARRRVVVRAGAAKCGRPIHRHLQLDPAGRCAGRFRPAATGAGAIRRGARRTAKISEDFSRLESEDRQLPAELSRGKNRRLHGATSRAQLPVRQCRRCRRPPATNAVPAPAVATAQSDAELAALRGQLQHLQADNTTLTAKLKEALAVQPAAIDSRELAKAQAANPVADEGK